LAWSAPGTKQHSLAVHRPNLADGSGYGGWSLGGSVSGPAQFGLLSYALAFVSIFSAVASMGLGRIVIRDIASNPECKNETLGTSFGLQFIGGLITLVLTVTVICLLRAC